MNLGRKADVRRRWFQRRQGPRRWPTPMPNYYHDLVEHLRQGGDALPLEPAREPGARVELEQLVEGVRMLTEGLNAGDAFIGNQAGDVKAALENSATTIEAIYSYPYQAHACMEPMNATARWTEERCEVWCPTQNGEAALEAAARAAAA